jgi:hypothetical protein
VEEKPLIFSRGKEICCQRSPAMEGSLPEKLSGPLKQAPPSPTVTAMGNEEPILPRGIFAGKAGFPLIFPPARVSW